MSRLKILNGVLYVNARDNVLGKDYWVVGVSDISLTLIFIYYIIIDNTYI